MIKLLFLSVFGYELSRNHHLSINIALVYIANYTIVSVIIFMKPLMSIFQYNPKKICYYDEWFTSTKTHGQDFELQAGAIIRRPRKYSIWYLESLNWMIISRYQEKRSVKMIKVRNQGYRGLLKNSIRASWVWSM